MTESEQPERPEQADGHERSEPRDGHDRPEPGDGHDRSEPPGMPEPSEPPEGIGRPEEPVPAAESPAPAAPAEPAPAAEPTVPAPPAAPAKPAQPVAPAPPAESPAPVAPAAVAAPATRPGPAAPVEHHRRDVPVGVVMVGMAAVAWWPAFTLGVWNEIFFDDVLTVWAASTAAFVFVLVERKPVGGKLVRAFLLLLPSLWILLGFIVEDDTADLAVALFDLFAILAVLIGIPFTLWVLVRIVWPDFATEHRPGTKWLIAVVVLGVAIASYILGLNHEHFLTCEDFAISGKHLPENCTHR